MDKAKTRFIERKRRAKRVRRSICGTAERPRLCVRRTLNHIYAQIIDDSNHNTIAQIGSTGKAFAEKTSAKDLSKTEISKIVGEMIADCAKEKGISTVKFDRKGYLFHGRVKALAEAARSKGLVF